MVNHLPSEENRLAILDLYKIMDTAAEQCFDDLSGLAAEICETPLSSISFISADRQWYKSRQGIDITETPRGLSFCTHTILDNDLTIVEDTRKDDRFKDLPHVKAEGGVRFYAGAPLEVKEGVRLGTICVMDLKPRTLTSQQETVLKTLARCVVAQLDLKRAQHDLETLRDVIPMCAWCRDVKITDDKDNSITWQPLDEYIMSIARVSHGICQRCSTDLES